MSSSFLDHAYGVIMAGGKGERFWPLSTGKRPKQLLSLAGGDRPMLAQAIDRLKGLIPPERFMVVTNETLVDATLEHIPELLPENVIGEPVGRDTAPAVALACAVIKERDPDAVFCILTADHVIQPIDTFQATIKAALKRASEEDILLTIGMEPQFASTGFGYIEQGEQETLQDGIRFYPAQSFREKPDLATAEQYLKSGRYLWNSGMFIWSVRALSKAFNQHVPDLYRTIEQVAVHQGTDHFKPALAEAFGHLEKISIDYALMEKADNIHMARGTFEWSDVGTWNAIEDHIEPDADGNVVIGQCASVDASGNIVHSENRLTALIGVTDLVVVQNEGVTLICPKDRAQDVKEMVVKLRERGDCGDLL